MKATNFITKKTNLLFLSTMIVLLLNSCSQHTENDTNTTSATTVVAMNDFELTSLLDRDKNLSYDEYVKINAKYEKLKAQYTKDPSDYAALLKLSEIYIYEARVTGEHPYYYTAALKTLDEILKYDGRLTKDQKFTALFYKATVQLSQHNFNEALETGNKALAVNNLNSGIYGVLVDANVEIGNYDQAVKMCEQMMKIRPDLRSYSRTSYLREIYGDLLGSKKAMLMAIEAGAPYSEYKCWAMVTLGKIYEAEGKLDSAAICYDLSTKERANYPFGIAGKASVEAKKGNYDTAKKTYDEALAILPEIGFNIELAGLMQKEGKTTEVSKMIEEIETMFKEDIESGHNMNLEFASFLYSFKNDYKTALEYGLEEFKNRPNNIDVNKLLASVYYGLEDVENAKKHVEVALRTAKKDADLICLSGLINKNADQVKQSFVLNPYQDHSFVEEGKKYL